jgi:hypothetical protein
MSRVPRAGLAFWLAVLALNVVLAVGVRLAAPAQPRFTDRETYENIAARGLAPDCRADIFCYRVLVPTLLARVPLEWEQRWRSFEALSVIAAGFVLAVASVRVAPPPHGPVLTTLLAQTSFGFTYTAYDPYTVDPGMYLLAAAYAWAWLANRPSAALAMGAIGVFVKQTAVLIAAASALAALLGPRLERRWLWVAQGGLVAMLLVGFYLVMDRFFGWPLESQSPSADLLGGGWLARWILEEGLWLGLFYTFAPYGLVWLYAALGFPAAPRRLRLLAIGALPCVLALVYVQTTERALANFFFVVLLLALVFLVQLPMRLAYLAVLTNGLFTAKVGLSTAWLPSSAIFLVVAVIVAIWVIVVRFGRWQRADQAPGGLRAAAAPTATPPLPPRAG